jgi:uncharacterized protein (TIGR02444 family)
VEGFWDFSVRTYRTSGVSDACLSLQNDYGADVNMLLYSCWIGAAIGAFDDELFDRTSKFSTTWAENIVIPLREARTWMKHTGCGSDPVPTEKCMQLRDEVKSVEFAAEKMQQEVLEKLTPVDQTRSVTRDQIGADVVTNLMLYLGFVDIQPTTEVREKLSVIVCAAFPQLDEDVVSKALEV